MEPVREQILNLQHISYTYHTLQGETLALSDISFSLKKGEFAAIVGPSGCGKSTLLSLICLSQSLCLSCHRQSQWDIQYSHTH